MHGWFLYWIYNSSYPFYLVIILTQIHPHIPISFIYVIINRYQHNISMLFQSIWRCLTLRQLFLSSYLYTVFFKPFKYILTIFIHSLPFPIWSDSLSNRVINNLTCSWICWSIKILSIYLSIKSFIDPILHVHCISSASNNHFAKSANFFQILKTYSQNPWSMIFPAYLDSSFLSFTWYLPIRALN